MSVGVRLPSRETGGAREEINLVQMVSDLNRETGGRSAAANNSWRHVEMDIDKLIELHPGSSLTVRVKYGAGGVRPLVFDVRLRDAAGVRLYWKAMANV